MKSEREILDKIKSQGYWEMIIRPLKFTKRFTQTEAKSWLENACVRYYGWTVPIITGNSEQCFFGQNYVEGIFDSSGVVEIWRLYTSGQLIYYRGFIEDWQRGDWYTGFASRETGKSLTKVKGIAVTVNEITMFYQLAKQMIETDMVGDRLKVSITLHDIQNRTLATESVMAMLYEDYTCRIPNFTLDYNYSKEELVNKYPEISMKSLLEIATVFNWTRDGVQTSLQQHQQKYLSG